MPLNLSPYVVSDAPGAWPNRRAENDRPSPLRINKPRHSTPTMSNDSFASRVERSSENAPALPLQQQTSNRLNVTKRRSLWALNEHTAQPAEEEKQHTFPPRPYSVGPGVALSHTHATHDKENDQTCGPQTAEEAEEMLREASRTYSGSSSNSNSWNSFVSGGCSVRKSSGTRSSSSVVRQVSSSTDGPSGTISMDSILPHVLSPHISIHTDSHGRYFGQDYVWATIEVSGILSHAYSADGTGTRPAQPKEEEHHLGMLHSSTIVLALMALDLFFKHGCLHDLKVEVLPVDGTTVLQIFHEQSFPT